MARIEKRLGKALPLSALFAAPTLEALAALVERSGGPARRSPLVAIKPRGSRAPLVCVHPVGGNVLCYLDLARELPPEQPVYAFQSPDPGDGQLPATVEGMAALYLRELRRVRPEGPYRLGGWSLGGLIAFEMARRLRSLQREVAFLGLLDAPDPARFPRLQDDGDGDAEMTILQYVTQRNPPVTLEGLRALDPEARLELILEQVRQEGVRPAALDLSELRRLVRIVRAHRRAVRAYEPQPFDTSLVYVRAAEGLGDDAVWAGLALGGAEVHEVPGSHMSMHYPPNTEMLAAALRTAVERALRRAEGAPEAGEEGVGVGREP
jgi:thioesterase domain-containing protein